jgi:hypothetical protein
VPILVVGSLLIATGAVTMRSSNRRAFGVLLMVVGGVAVLYGALGVMLLGL